MKNQFAGFFKKPSTRGGKIRLLGLLATSIGAVVYPPAAVFLNAALKVLIDNIK